MAVLAVSALIFYWAGARLYADGEISQTNLYALFEAGVIGVFSAGRLLTYVPDLGRAIAAFRKIVGWSERKPRVAQLPSTDQPFTGIGDIVFSDVELRYPQRPDHPALTGLNLVIKSGQTHAFVGPSGAGKSTILQMVARFYDPAFGTLSVGGIDVRTVPVEVFREKIGLVSQDPVLIRCVFPELQCSAQVLIRFQQRLDWLEHLARLARSRERDACPAGGGMRAGVHPRLHPLSPGWLRQRCGREGRAAQRRPEAASLHRAGTHPRPQGEQRCAIYACNHD
jgi:ABC-type siderophore export system fused ATPase/permease subunit